MKKTVILLFVTQALCAADIAPSNEIEVLDNMIRKTEERLADQKLLREKMIEFQDLRNQFLADQKTRACAFKMTHLAPVILEKIDAYHLRQMFPSYYIEELEAFVQLGAKRT